MAHNSRETPRSSRSALVPNLPHVYSASRKTVDVLDILPLQRVDSHQTFLRNLFADERLFSAGHHERLVGVATAAIAGSSHLRL